MIIVCLLLIMDVLLISGILLFVVDLYKHLNMLMSGKINMLLFIGVGYHCFFFMLILLTSGEISNQYLLFDPKGTHKLFFCLLTSVELFVCLLLLTTGDVSLKKKMSERHKAAESYRTKIVEVRVPHEDDIVIEKIFKNLTGGRGI